LRLPLTAVQPAARGDFVLPDDFDIGLPGDKAHGLSPCGDAHFGERLIPAGGWIEKAV